MPLYVFACPRCSHRFEDLVRPEERPACPECGAPEAERQLPRVAVQSGARSADPALGSCGTCGDPRGPGACTLD
jgi:putative FmdB family regulatory protein